MKQRARAEGHVNRLATCMHRNCEGVAAVVLRMHMHDATTRLWLYIHIIHAAAVLRWTEHK